MLRGITYHFDDKVGMLNFGLLKETPPPHHKSSIMVRQNVY